MTEENERFNQENQADTEAEAYGYREHQGQAELYARREPRFGRLIRQETVKDIAGATPLLREYEDWSRQEGRDDWTIRQVMKAAADMSSVYSISPDRLREEGIIEGGVNADGYLNEGGKVLHNGYAIRVDKDIRRVEIVVPDDWVDEQGNRHKRSRIREQTVVIERPYYGTKNERDALAFANESLFRMMETGVKLHFHTSRFDSNKAALDNLVAEFYFKQIGLTNEQIGWFFNAPDISKIDVAKTDKENRKNQELGDKRDKAMRLLYLVGKCETREKMLDHLNTTYNLEEILDEKTVEVVMAMMRNDPKLGEERRWLAANLNSAQTFDDKFRLAVKYLLGDGVEVTGDTGQRKYEIYGWLTAEQRDPSLAANDADASKRGLEAPEKLESNARGFLTKFGNPYTRGSLDAMYALLGRISQIVGDPYAVRDADRFFWTTGMRDELGLEIFASRQGGLPSGEKLVEAWNKTEDVKDWDRNIRDKYSRLFSLPGEPVGSDLSKIFYPHYYRLKDLLRHRPSGPLLTVDKFERFTQGMLNVCFTQIETAEGDSQFRSVVEQWLGYKGDDVLKQPEKAKDLGDIPWQQVTIPAEVSDALRGEDVSPEARIPIEEKGVNKIFSQDMSGVGDNAYGFFWLMNYLAGDKDFEKRPWAFVNLDNIDPRDLLTSKAYTGRNKFLDIIYNRRTVPWGDWRKWYRQAINEGVSATKLLDNHARAMVDKARKDWFAGLRSLPQYPFWRTQEVKYHVYTPEGTVKTNTLNLAQVIEGRQPGKGLAHKYGYLDPKVDCTVPPPYQMRIFA